jgi:hypothetical protein
MRTQLLSSTALRLREALVAAGAPEDKAIEAVKALVAFVKPEAAPPMQIESPDMTVGEVCAFRRESQSTVIRKMKLGVYRSYRSGPDKRLITRDSVIADRDACLARGSGFDEAPTENSESRSEERDLTDAGL